MAEHFAIVRWDDEREEEFFSFESYVSTPHIASILIDESVYDDEAALDAAMERTFLVCLEMGVPIQHHFRRIHVHDASGHVQEDWALSDLGFYLLLLNGDVHKAAVAAAQAFAIRRMCSKHS